jgi:hypothetical protein
MLRPILLALALTASSASAAPSGMSPLPIGFAPAAHGGFTGGIRFGSGIGHRPFRGAHRHFRHDRRDQDGNGAVGYGWGVPVAEDAPAVADGGFFADGEAFATRAGHVLYDYDRGYPYERYRPAFALRAASSRAAVATPSCTMEHAVRVCRR